MRFFRLEKIDRFLKRDLRGDIEIHVETCREIVSGGFYARLFEGFAFVQNELQRRLERDFDRAAVDFAIALYRMAIAGEKLSALVEHRKNNDEPMPQNLRSILPPQAPAAWTRPPKLVGGETAIMPMKGLSGISISSENSATRRSRSRRITFAAGSFKSLGNTPLPGPVLLTPYGTRNLMSCTLTSNMSPSSAPST